jgi:phage gp36-like protein
MLTDNQGDCRYCEFILYTLCNERAKRNLRYKQNIPFLQTVESGTENFCYYRLAY